MIIIFIFFYYYSYNQFQIHMNNEFYIILKKEDIKLKKL